MDFPGLRSPFGKNVPVIAVNPRITSVKCFEPEIISTIIRYMSKLRYLLLVPSSSCGKIHLAAYQHVRTYGRRNNHAGPVKDWPAAAHDGNHHKRPGPNL